MSAHLHSDDEYDLRTRGYVAGKTIGQGSYAKVKVALSKKLDIKVAVKIISLKRAPRDFVTKFLPREIDVAKNLEHPNVIKMHETFQMGGRVYIIMEMAGHGDLLEHIKLRGAMSEDKGRHFFKQLVDGIAYLHKNEIVHRDLKCENILLDSNNTLKITDFGFCRNFKADELSRTYCGSAAYAAPEVLQGVPYNCFMYDVWSMGIILYIMCCGSMPYDDNNPKRLIKLQNEKKVEFRRHGKEVPLSSELKSLIHSILEINIPSRATIDTIRQSTWMTNSTPATPTRHQLIRSKVRTAKSKSLTSIPIATTEQMGV